MSTFVPTEIPDVVLVTPRVYEDDRGWFVESYHQDAFAEGGIPTTFVQDNHSSSQRGSVRGLHFQLPPHAQAKLVRVVRGEIFDVAVDVRRTSPTYGRWIGTQLSQQNRQMLYIPEGFAHGFCALTDGAEVIYKVSAPYDQRAERGVIWNDADLSITWPSLDVPYRLSDRDQRYPRLNDLSPDDNPF